jgi:hypothetical protein
MVARIGGRAVRTNVAARRRVTRCDEQPTEPVTETVPGAFTTRHGTAADAPRRPAPLQEGRLMATLRRAVLATAMLSTGLLSTTGMAFAGNAIDSGSHHDGTTVQKGLINSSDFAPNTTGEACNNDVPVNGPLGIQVPVQDNSGSVPILSKAGEGNTAANAKSCHNPIHAIN